MAIAIADIADDQLLEFIWKKYVRARLRSMTLNNFNLCPDPLHYAAYDWDLPAFISNLVREIRLGQFAPSRGELVRAAKSSGLSRPLCFLTTRDALMYKAITWMARENLVYGAPDWVASDDDVVPETDDGEESGAEEGKAVGDSFEWFNFWLKQHGGLIDMLRDASVSHVVESDIANFYPSIRLDAVREHLLAQAGLEKEVVRLCVQIIDGVMPRSDYAETSLMGLPQEQLDSSRPIAHSLLMHVDKEFWAEGESGRYRRYMDDILITVPNVRAGQAAISRLQRRLETLGLYPNPEKTRIVTKQQCFDERMIGTDLEIEQLSVEIEKQRTDVMPYGRVITPEQRDKISAISKRHRSVAPRPKRWDRVTRRLYTLHREANIRDWRQYWRSDLDADPGSAANIFEYVRCWPLSGTTVQSLRDASAEYSHLYSDISLLAAEVVLTAPIQHNERLWRSIANISRNEFERLAELGTDDPAYERIAASWLLAAWKYADLDERRSLIASLPTQSASYSAIQAQALPLVAAQGEIPVDEWISVRPGLDWETALAVEYLRGLEGKNRDALETANQLIKVRPRLKPQRFSMLPRALPLLDVVGRVDPSAARRHSRRSLRDLQKNPLRLRDKRLEYLVSQWQS